MRARYYNPVIGRFTQEDTYYGDGLNLYAYCRGNPVGYYDPSGYGKEKYQTIQEMKKTYGWGTQEALDYYRLFEGIDNVDSLNEGVFNRYSPDGKTYLDVVKLPSEKGIEVPGRLTVEQMSFLTQEYGVEFGLVYEFGSGKNGGGGQYWLYSGTYTQVKVPIAGDKMLIYHTHPKGSSGGDRKVMKRLKESGSPQ